MPSRSVKKSLSKNPQTPALDKERIDGEKNTQSTKESVDQFRSAFEQAGIGAAHVSIDGKFLRVNDKFCEITGYSRAELLELTFAQITVPEDTEVSQRAREEMAARRKKSFVAEKRYRRKDGSLVWVKLTTTLVSTINEADAFFISIIEDISERKAADLHLLRLNRLYKVLSKINGLIIRVSNRLQLYEDLCRILVEDGLLLMSFIVEVDAESGGVKPVASWGEMGDYLKQVTIATAAGPLSHGTVGTALRTGQYDVCNDVAADPRMAPWRAAALAQQFNAAAAFPLMVSGKVFGALVMGSAEIGFFQAEEIELMVAVANNLSFAVEAIQKDNERRAAESALRTSEANMAAAQRIARFGSWELDLANRENLNANPLRWSDEMFRIAGLEPGQVLVTNELFFSMVPAEEHSTIQAAVAKALSERTQYSVIHRFLRADGEERILHEVAEPLFDERTGQLIKMVGTAHDITEARRSEEAIIESEMRFRQLAENIQEVFWLSDVEKQKILYVSPSFERIWGVSCEALYQSPMLWLEAICPEDRERILLNAITKQAAGEYNEEYRIIRPDGESRWISDRGFPIRDAEGKVYRIAGVAQDITEGKRALEKIRQNEHLLTIAGHMARLGAWRYDVGAGFVVWSDEVCAIHEVPFGTAPDLEAALQFYPLEYRKTIAEAVEACIQEGTEFDLELEIITAKNRRIWVRTIGNAQKDEIGRVVRIQGAFQDISVQKELAADLGKERARLISAQAVAKVGSWETDLETLAVNWSDETYRIFEVDPQTFKPTHAAFLDFVHPDDRAAVDEFFFRSQGEGGSFIISHRVLLPGNKIKFLEERWQIFRDSFGKAIRAFGTCQDVTERELARENLRKSEERFRELAEKIHEVFYILEPADGKVLYVSPAYEVIWGRSCASLLENPLSYLNDIFPEDREEVEATYPRFLAGESTVVEYRILRPDGEMRWIRDYSYPVVKPGTSEVDHIVGVSHDITARKIFESKLREQASLLDIAHDAILVRTLDHRITYWNKSAEKLYGWTEAEAIGNFAPKLLQQDIEPFLLAFEKVMQDGEWLGELKHATKTGKPLLVEARWTLVRGENGTPQSILAINTDITERREFEKQLLRTQRLDSIGTLAGGIAHDLNNVFAPIMISIELLKGYAAMRENAELLDIILSSAQRGADMVAQVLSFARGMEGHRVEVQPRHLMNEIKRIIIETFPKNIRLEMNLDEDLSVIQGDPTQLHQVLLNLCVNARDAMPNGGTLTISVKNVLIDEHYAAMKATARPGRHICIHVEDTGVGIPQNVIDQIFDPFFTTKDIGKGTGLGLSTSLAIVTSHGGFIQTYSETGKGTTFNVYFPVSEQRASVPPNGEITRVMRGDGQTVLLVDDEMEIRHVTSRTLQAFGYRVLDAAEGTEAVAIYAEHEKDIHVVIIDMMMPGMDGPATIRVLRRMNPDIRIIATSGIEASYDKDLNAECFLRKPYTADTLLNALNDVLRTDKNE